MRAGVVATCDAAAPPFDTENFDIAAAQIAGAGTLVLTKLDRAEPDVAEALAGRLGAINPLAGCVVETDPIKRAIAAFAAPGRIGLTAADATGHPRIAVMTARIGLVGFDALMEWLENLAGLAGERLLRVKGVVRLEDVVQRLLIQAVGTVFSPPRPFEGPAEAGLVIIARDMDATEIAAMQPGFPVRFEAGAAGPWRRAAVQRLGAGSAQGMAG
jgi:G3E family GTPase